MIPRYMAAVTNNLIEKTHAYKNGIIQDSSSSIMIRSCLLLLEIMYILTTNFLKLVIS